MAYTIYQDEFYGGFTETLQQETNAFNAASGGCITLAPNEHIGNYQKESFWKTVSALVARRDTSSSSTQSDTAVAMGEQVGVKCHRKIAPLAINNGDLKLIGSGPSEFSFLMGQQIAKAVAIDYLNTALRAANSALSGTAALNHDYSGTGTITHGALNTALSKRGDAAGAVALLVMHSKQYFDLMGQAITDKIYGVANATIMEGSVATFGRRVLVTDSADLWLDDTTDKYYLLGLVPGAVMISESERAEVVMEQVTGYENLFHRIQGEHGLTVKVKGYTWDVANGGANPDDTALKLNTNWDASATSDKDKAGVRLVTQ